MNPSPPAHPPPPPPAPSRAERLAWLAPTILAILLVGTLTALLASMGRRLAIENQNDLEFHAEAARDSMALRLDNAQRYVSLLAEKLSDQTLEPPSFHRLVNQFAEEQSGIEWIAYAGPSLDVEWTIPEDESLPGGIFHSLDPEVQGLALAAIEQRRPLRTPPFNGPQGDKRVALILPISTGGRPIGLLSIHYSCEKTLRGLAPRHVAGSHRLSLLDASGRRLGSMPSIGRVDPRFTRRLPLPELGRGVELLAERYRTPFVAWEIAALGALCLALAIGVELAVLGLRRQLARRRKAETELLRQTHLYETLLQAQSELGEGFILARAGKVLFANDAARRIAGRTIEELRAMGSLFDLLTPDAQQTRRAGRQGRLVRPGANERFETVIAHPSGREVHLDVCSRGVQLDGEPSHVFIVRDMTGRKLAEEGARQLEARVQHAQRLESLGLFAGGIAHDFNNLLTAILANADLAAMDMPEDSPARPYIDLIQFASWRAADLTSQVLAYAGGGQATSLPVDLTAEVREIRDLLSTITSKKAALLLDLTDGMPCVRADATQIRQIIMNLVSNASEALGNNVGTITVRTRASDGDSGTMEKGNSEEGMVEGGQVVLEVADTGCGMDDAVRARIFEPFYSTKFAGRGLGLAAVMGIVRRHHGLVEVDSQPGKGSTFRVCLPACADAEAAPAPIAESHTQWTGQGSALVVDDEEPVRDVARRILERVGFTVLTANDGRDAVEIFRDKAGSIDVVLLDLTMPRMGGEEAYEKLRRINPRARIILSSGFTEAEAAKRFGGNGPVNFIQKPYQPSSLVDKVRTTLES